MPGAMIIALRTQCAVFDHQLEEIPRRFLVCSQWAVSRCRLFLHSGAPLDQPVKQLRRSSVQCKSIRGVVYTMCVSIRNLKPARNMFASAHVHMYAIVRSISASRLRSIGSHSAVLAFFSLSTAHLVSDTLCRVERRGRGRGGGGGAAQRAHAFGLRSSNTIATLALARAATATMLSSRWGQSVPRALRPDLHLEVPRARTHSCGCVNHVIDPSCSGAAVKADTAVIVAQHCMPQRIVSGPPARHSGVVWRACTLKIAIACTTVDTRVIAPRTQCTASKGLE